MDIKSTFTFERNPNSTAFIADGRGDYYWAGALHGGDPKNFNIRTKQIMDNIDKDLTWNFIAAWHEESHINRYFLDNPPAVIKPAGFLTGEGGQKSITGFINLNKNKDELRS